MTARRIATQPRSARSPRGSATETRSRVVQAAAAIFNRDGYEGTDSNRIAREAGYSPGTFYKHFADKRSVFLAVYEEWVAREWREVSAMVAETGSAHERAERIVAMFLHHHRRWRGFRASLRALVAHDAEVCGFYRTQRRLQLDALTSMRAASSLEPTREADALLLFTLERTADALAEGEPDAIGVRPAQLRALLVDLVRVQLTRLSNEPCL